MLRNANRVGRKGTAAVAAGLAMLLAAVTLALTGGQVGASGGRSGVSQPGDLATCFIQAIRDRGGWRVQREVIVGTAFLNVEGTPVGTRVGPAPQP